MAKDRRKSNGHISRASKTYGSYMFKEKDPGLGELQTQYQDHFGVRRIGYKQMKAVEDAGGASVGAQRGWFEGDTLRPSNAAMEASGRAIGRKRVWVAHRPNR